MKYKEKINQFVFEGSEAEFAEWLISQPEMEQPEIMRELKVLTEEFYKQKGLIIPEDVVELKDFDKVIDRFEDAILDSKLAEDFLIQSGENLENHVRKMAKADYNIREHIINSIVNNEPNAPQMRKLAQKMIDLEKRENFYNAELWKGLPEE